MACVGVDAAGRADLAQRVGGVPRRGVCAERVEGAAEVRLRRRWPGGRRGASARGQAGTAERQHERQHRDRGPDDAGLRHGSPRRSVTSRRTVPRHPGVRTSRPNRSTSMSGRRQHLADEPEVLLARHLRDPERGEVRGLPLGVDQPVLAVVEPGDQSRQGRLRRIGLVVEHRLTREQTADRDAVQTADEPAVPPGLDGVHPAQGVQAQVGLADLVVDPARGARRVGAGVDHLGARRVERGARSVASTWPANVRRAGRAGAGRRGGPG